MEKKKYPIGEEHYTLYEEIGTGVSASVYRALCNSLDEVVAIKILDFERDNCDLNNICREAQTMVLVDHPNVVKSHCSFVNGHSLWVVMPYMAGGSCLHILKATYQDGFEEVVIATILREALKGLEYLHSQGHIHRDIKAGNILIGSRGSIKLGDFGVSACLFDSGDRQRHRNTFVGTPCWMAPEVMEQVNGYDLKADIWSFGITALELAHGHAPFSKYPPLKVLLMTLQNAPPGLDYERDKKFSKSFRQMIASCLVKDPSKRPSAKKLLKHSFFKQARSSDYILRTLLEGLPDLGNRVQALKRKDEEMLAQQKIPDGEREEISQNEYKRGISSWNFDLEDLKAQASLVTDEDLSVDKDQKGSSISLLDLDTNVTQLQQQVPSPSQLAQLQPEISSSGIGGSDDNAADSAMATNITKGVKSDDDTSTPSLMHENHNELNVEINSANKTDLGENGKSSENLKTSILQSDKSESHTQSTSNKTEPERNGKPSENLKTSILQSDKSESHPQSTSMDNGNVSLKNSDVPSEISLKASKTAAVSSELDEKAKCHVVQQRGRFKVTSENVDFERASPCSSLQKSHSMQVISQHPAISPPVTSVDPTPLIFNHSLYPMLETLLQTNISQREGILSIMRQVSTGETAVDGGGIPITSTSITEKSLLEAAHDREKELLHEISELQWRLIRAQEELQKYKTEKANGGI